MRILCAALCVAVFACLYTFPASAGNCVPLADHVAQVKTQPSLVDTLMLDGDKLQKVIAYVQALTGGDEKYDTGYLAWTSTHVAIFLGNGGQICTVLVGPIQHLPRMIEAAEGRPA
jgi:hypothetical protein